MDKELKELNKQIEGYVKGRKADESIFNFGVQLGRILEKNKVENYRLSFFSEQEAKENQLESKRTRIDSVNKILQKIICLAHKEEIRENGSISYDAGWRGRNAPLNKEIEEKYNITYSSINQTNVGGDFDIYFMLNGQLKDLFEKHNVPTQIEITLSNSSGEEEEYLRDEEDVDNFYSPHISLYPHHDNITLEKVDAFAKDVEKFYTIFCLKLN